MLTLFKQENSRHNGMHKLWYEEACHGNIPIFMELVMALFGHRLDEFIIQLKYIDFLLYINGC